MCTQQAPSADEPLGAANAITLSSYANCPFSEFRYGATDSVTTSGTAHQGIPICSTSHNDEHSVVYSLADEPQARGRTFQACDAAHSFPLRGGYGVFFKRNCTKTQTYSRRHP